MAAYAPRSLRGSFEKYHARVQGGHTGDDVELADQSFGNTTPIPIRTIRTDCVQEESNGVMITTNATVVKSML